MMHIISSQTSVNVPSMNRTDAVGNRKRLGRLALTGLVLAMIIGISTVITALLGNSGAYAAASLPAEQHTVIVERGDTLWSIANEHIAKGGNPREYIYELKKKNGLKDASIRAGQQLLLP
ncbi:LysM peptidoglycan-binding domain-containing protein [Paenibacillus validus]|uniref:LysM peptidoglycan-binding domain-containing protein n=1 Tax=Paenibacillus validus TaxID=44253 RepID=UPI001FD11D5D|nr:LysM peptidoglycan-binding domain-containing protein [Paenibacillus validus]MED4602950.1 LysM peptidoglycan-binding domain-containing protein [Paenibacillus validus]MED4608455.1 LysM peptidoglycan-binding domain-containing protein [Paenibacillus validus]